VKVTGDAVSRDTRLVDGPHAAPSTSVGAKDDAISADAQPIAAIYAFKLSDIALLRASISTDHSTDTFGSLLVDSAEIAE
jgi:hypothetical protein